MLGRGLDVNGRAYMRALGRKQLKGAEYIYILIIRSSIKG
jgi:hypothetical protein